MSTMILLTIIADDSLKSALEDEITSSGATGFTTSPVEGKGKTGVRNDVWSGNVKIETIIDEKILDSITQKLKQHYFDKYSIIAYWHSVSVVRASHFSD